MAGDILEPTRGQKIAVSLSTKIAKSSKLPILKDVTRFENGKSNISGTKYENTTITKEFNPKSNDKEHLLNKTSASKNNKFLNKDSGLIKINESYARAREPECEQLTSSTKTIKMNRKMMQSLSLDFEQESTMFRIPSDKSNRVSSEIQIDDSKKIPDINNAISGSIIDHHHSLMLDFEGNNDDLFNDSDLQFLIHQINLNDSGRNRIKEDTEKCHLAESSHNIKEEARTGPNRLSETLVFVKDENANPSSPSPGYLTINQDSLEKKMGAYDTSRSAILNKRYSMPASGYKHSKNNFESFLFHSKYTDDTRPANKLTRRKSLIYPMYLSPRVRRSQFLQSGFISNQGDITIQQKMPFIRGTKPKGPRVMRK